MVWRIPDAAGDVEGSLNHDGTGIYLDGPLGLVAELTVWLRAVIPSWVDLLLFDDTYSQACRLFPGMTPADIQDGLVAT